MKTISDPQPSVNHVLSCNFCYKPDSEVIHLIASHDGQSHICNECLASCVTIVLGAK